MNYNGPKVGNLGAGTEVLPRTTVRSCEQSAICWKTRVSATTRLAVTPHLYDAGMPSSDNVSSAENQQERLLSPEWIVGFVDGEGCFSVPIQRNNSMKLGWQVQPTFAVVQGASSRGVLEDLVQYFGCGSVIINRRHDNHREDLFRYCVTRFDDLSNIIVPFFEQNLLRTSKRANFDKFADVIRLMAQRRHLSVLGLMEIAATAETMNHRKPSEVLRILRDHTPTLFLDSQEEEEMVRTLRRRREVGGNDQPANQN